ncbi:hypothetical protein HQ584_04495 [Patescibacteria group bacterium]|nr:hypothetical protein [Patescibacteria group bacterium]
MKPPLLTILIFLICLPLQAGDITQELRKIGLTQYNLINYEEKDGIGYFTFSDWKTEKSGDTVVFTVEDGKIKECIKAKILGVASL